MSEAAAADTAHGAVPAGYGTRPYGMRERLNETADWTLEMEALEKRIPGMKWLRPHAPDGPHKAVWGDGESATRDTLRELVLYLQARFGRRR